VHNPVQVHLVDALDDIPKELEPILPVELTWKHDEVDERTQSKLHDCKLSRDRDDQIAAERMLQLNNVRPVVQ
jgi:hypothetical protein